MTPPRATGEADLGSNTSSSDQAEDFFSRVVEHRGIGHAVEGGDVFDWVLGEGRTRLRGPALFDELCWRMIGKGVRLWRATFSTPTLHPQFLGYGYRWWRDRNTTEEFQVRRGITETQDYRESPIRVVMEQGEVVRHRLAFPEAAAAIAQYSVLRTLRDGGATDYLATPLTSFNGRFQTTPRRVIAVEESYCWRSPSVLMVVVLPFGRVTVLVLLILPFP